MRYDPREYIFLSILRVRVNPYVPYKWNELFKLAFMLGDYHLSRGLHSRIRKIEHYLQMDLFEIETYFLSSQNLDNFFLIEGKKITELEVQMMFNDIDIWLVEKLTQLKDKIRFSKPPPLIY